MAGELPLGQIPARTKSSTPHDATPYDAKPGKSLIEDAAFVWNKIIK